MINEAIWFVVGNEVVALLGVVFALYVVLSFLVVVLTSQRWDFWSVWRKEAKQLPELPNQRKLSEV